MTGRKVEPFNLFGPEAAVDSIPEAARILRENSYYFYVMGIIGLCAAGTLWFSGPVLHRTATLGAAAGVFYLLAGFFVGRRRSRLMAIAVVVNAVYTIVFNLMSDPSLGIWFIGAGLMLAAGSRSVRASFAFHRLRAS